MNSSAHIFMVIIPMTSITIKILFITSIIKIIFLVTKIKSSLAMFHSRPASVGEDPRALSARHQQQCCNNIRIHRQYIVFTFLVNIKHILLLTCILFISIDALQDQIYISIPPCYQKSDAAEFVLARIGSR